MDKLKTHLNTIGLGLLLAAFVASRVWPRAKILFLALAVCGLAAVAAYLALHAGELKEGLKRKSFLYSSNLLLLVVVVLGILVLLNTLGARHHKRFDFTQAKIHSLSDQSIKIVKSLKTDIEVKAFFREGNMGRKRMEDLLKIYAYHSPRVKYEFIDPDKNPGLVKRYEITADGTTVLEAGDKDTRITATAEEDLTNAIVKVTREKRKAIYFLEGHGELTTEGGDENGLSFAKDELVKLSYEVNKLVLALPETFPKDCAALVVPGPKKDLLPAELETIRKYVEDGGRVFFMVDPETAPNLPPFLEAYGFRLQNDIIIDQPSIFGGDYLMPVMSGLEYHEISRNFRYATIYPLARSVDIIDPKPEAVQSSQVLGRTSDYAHAKKDFALKQKMTVKDIAFDPKTDKRGPIPLAALATLKAKTGTDGKTLPEGRIVVFGDSDFASNRFFNYQGNGNLFLNALNWLTEEEDLISIAPKTSNPRTISLTPSRGKLVFWISVVLLPLAVLAVGISIWMRRRSL
ncbi:MAG: hypothetical protein FJY82_05270 [Candidatus Aminicenantes bacterium]|nr:hypothetical protein [Candidatus Aminicenantes bacterium]